MAKSCARVCCLPLQEPVGCDGQCSPCLPVLPSLPDPTVRPHQGRGWHRVTHRVISATMAEQRGETRAWVLLLCSYRQQKTLRHARHASWLQPAAPWSPTLPWWLCGLQGVGKGRKGCGPEWAVLGTGKQRRAVSGTRTTERLMSDLFIFLQLCVIDLSDLGQFGSVI